VKMIMNSETIDVTAPWARMKDQAIVKSIRRVVQPESPVPQTPEGDFIVTIKIGDKVLSVEPIRIRKAGQDFPELVVKPSQIMIFIVRDVKIKLYTPFNTPMANAEIIVAGDAVELVGTGGSYTADSEGVIVIPYALLGYVEGGGLTPTEVSIEVAAWRGMPIDYGVETSVKEEIDVVVPKIGKLVVEVVDPRGAAVSGAEVVLRGLATISNHTDTNGISTAEVVEGAWTIEVQGKSTSVNVRGDAINRVKLVVETGVTWMTQIYVVLLVALFLLGLVVPLYHRRKRGKRSQICGLPRKTGRNVS